ncbi:MAG: redox-sensing transcriptional repressor Rex [Candidatus Omnitrophota bacterium]
MINKKCIIRLLRYKNALHRLNNLGFVKVFSDNLADAVGVTASQVRKDFSLFGICGHKRGGYKIEALLEKLNHILGKNEQQKVVIVGSGNIGSALMKYRGFEKEGMKIAACFDIDPAKYDRKEGDIPVLPLEGLRDFVREHNIKIGIIAVPDIAAQQVLDLMLAAGIKGVVNFAPIRLRAASGAVINNVNLVLELETVIYFIINGLEKSIAEIHEEQKS